MNKDIEVTAISVRSQPELLTADHQSTRTSFRKQPIAADAIYLTYTGFEGDSVTHTEHHGGNDKAVCCYNSAHFDYWHQRLGFDFAPSAFGENLTLAGEQALETNVFIGDRYQLGDAVVEISEPRAPCYIIGIRYNYKPFVAHLQETGFTGFYMRTVYPGTVKNGDKLVHLSSHPERISVHDVNRIRYHDATNKDWLDRLVALDVLTARWRQKFEALRRKVG